MSVTIALRGDFSAKQLRNFAKKTKDGHKHDDCWRWRQFMMEHHAPRQRRWVASGFRSFEIGCCGSMPGGRTAY